MSSPDVQAKAHPEGPPAESSSLLRWLIVSAVIVLLAVAAAIVVRMLPTEGRTDESGLSFKIPARHSGPPGKVVLTESTTYQFDVMPQETKGTHTWVFKNGGKGDLELSKGPATCSCTIANFADETARFILKPGESTEITLAWETRKFDGRFQKSATINVLGDPNRERVDFAVEGVVKPAVNVAPAERILNLGSIPNDQPASSKFAIASADKPDLKLLSVTSSRPDEIVLKPGPLSDADRKAIEWTSMKGGYLVQVELKPSKSLGPFSEEITVTTDHPLVKEIRLTVGGKRIGPITVTPETARIHNVSPGSGASTTVMILVRNAPDTKLKVLEAPDNLKVEITPADLKTGSTAKVRQYRMTVTVPPDSPPGIISGAIVLKSDHPLADRITVPVDITVLGGQ